MRLHPLRIKMDKKLPRNLISIMRKKKLAVPWNGSIMIDKLKLPYRLIMPSYASRKRPRPLDHQYDQDNPC